MASALPITNQLGKQQQLPAGDNLLVRGGIDVDAAGALNLAPTTATSVVIGGAASAVASVTVGKSGTDTTVLGNLVVNENFSANVSAVAGIIDLGDGSNDTISVGGGVGDTILMKGLIGNGAFPNLSFGNGQDHAIDVATSASETIGRALSVGPGAGGASAGVAAGGNGGALSLLGSAGGAGSGAFAGGKGSTINILAGTGGAAAGAGAGGNGGLGAYIAGTGGAGSATGVSGRGGAMTLTAGSAGADGGAGQGLGGSITIDAGSGSTKGDITIGGSNASAIFSGNITDNPLWTHAGTMTLSSSAAAVSLTTGSPSKVDTTANYAEAIRMNSTGTGAEVASILVGDANPNGDVTGGSAGSIYLDGLAGKAYLKTDNATAWVEMATGVTTVSRQAAYDGGTDITQDNTQGSMTIDRGTNATAFAMLSLTDSSAVAQDVLKISKTGAIGGNGISITLGATSTGDGVNIKTNGGGGKAYSGTIGTGDKALQFDGGGANSTLDLGVSSGGWVFTTATGAVETKASSMGLFGGDGGASAGAAAGGNGASIVTTGGVAGAGSGTQSAGLAGAVDATAGAGGASGTATGTASAGGAVTLTAGVGGASTVTSDQAGAGGGLTFIAGAGGTASGVTSGGGNGGAVSITAGSSGTGTAGTGGGGAVTISAGAGGSFLGGGDLTLNAGDGSGSNGAGGDVFINPGLGSSGGAIGTVNISTVVGEGGQINVGNTTDNPTVFHKGTYNLAYDGALAATTLAVSHSASSAIAGTAVDISVGSGSGGALVVNNAGTGSGADITASGGGAVMSLRTGAGATKLRFNMDGNTGLITLNNDETAAATNSSQQLVLASNGANVADVSLYTVDADPNTVVTATRGSLALADTGVAYINTDGATAWSALAAGTMALQQAYVAGPAIVGNNTQKAVSIDRGTNTTNEALKVTDTGNVAQNTVAIDKSPGAVTAGAALSVTTNNNASGATLLVNGGTNSSAIQVQSNSADVLVVDLNGNYTVTTGTSSISLLAEAKTGVTISGSMTLGTKVSGTATNGAGDVTLSSNTVSTTAGAVTVESSSTTGTASDVRIQSKVTGAGTAGDVYVASDPGATGSAGGVMITANGTISAPTAGNVELDASVDITLNPGTISTPLPVNGGTSTNNTDLDGTFAASSIVGCLNELKTGATSADTTVPALTNGTTALTAGQVVSLDNNGGNSRAFPADANVAGRTNAVGLAKADAATGATVDIIVAGETTVADALWDTSAPVVGDTGKRVYMSVTAGNLTLTAPTTTGDTVLRVGIVSFAAAGANTTRVIVQIGEPTVL